MSLSETMVDGASSDSEVFEPMNAEDVITMLSAFNPHTINGDDKTRVRTLIAETAIVYSDASEVEIYNLMSVLEILSSPVVATRLKMRKRLGFKDGLVDLATQATEEVLNALQDKGRTGYICHVYPGPYSRMDKHLVGKNKTPQTVLVAKTVLPRIFQESVGSSCAIICECELRKTGVARAQPASSGCHKPKECEAPVP